MNQTTGSSTLWTNSTSSYVWDSGVIISPSTVSLPYLVGECEICGKEIISTEGYVKILSSQELYFLCLECAKDKMGHLLALLQSKEGYCDEYPWSRDFSTASYSYTITLGGLVDMWRKCELCGEIVPDFANRIEIYFSNMVYSLCWKCAKDKVAELLLLLGI